MTNKEKYKQAFSVLKSSGKIPMGEKTMAEQMKKIKFKKTVAALTACGLIIGAAGAAYAADLGGIKSTVQVWIHGVKTDAVMDYNPQDGSYSLSKPENGAQVEIMGGGGVAYDENGKERPLTQDELLEEINSSLYVEYEDDGSVWVYWYSQKVDITDKFKDGVCKIELNNGDEKLYVTVKDGETITASPDGYVD